MTTITILEGVTLDYRRIDAERCTELILAKGGYRTAIKITDEAIKSVSMQQQIAVLVNKVCMEEAKAINEAIKEQMMIDAL